MDTTDCSPVDIVEQEEVITKYSSAEMWGKLPVVFKEEVFSFFNLQNGNRLCRVSSEWKFAFGRLALYNKGRAVFYQKFPDSLDLQEWRKDRYGIHRRSTKPDLWEENLMMRDSTMTHLVFVVVSNQGYFFRNLLRRTAEKLITLKHPLNTVTICKGIMDNVVLYDSLLQLLENKVKVVRFIDCTADTFPVVILVPYKKERVDYDWGRLTDAMWTFPIVHSDRRLTNEALQRLKSQNPNEFSGACYKYFAVWQMPQKLSDWLLFWPYLEEQFEWLKQCLGSLDVVLTEELTLYVHSCWLDLQEQREDDGLWVLPWMKKMGWTWKDRELDVLDCAYLARVLNIVPGLPNPPVQLPQDLHSSRSLDVRPWWR